MTKLLINLAEMFIFAQFCINKINIVARCDINI